MSSLRSPESEVAEGAFARAVLVLAPSSFGGPRRTSMIAAASVLDNYVRNATDQQRLRHQAVRSCKAHLGAIVVGGDVRDDAVVDDQGEVLIARAVGKT